MILPEPFGCQTPQDNAVGKGPSLPDLPLQQQPVALVPPPQVTMIDVETINVDDNLRGDDADPDLPDLTRSIEHEGLLQPILVRRDPISGRCTLIAGSRRLAAVRGAGRKTIPALIDDRAYTPLALLLAKLAENLQRRALPPVQIAKALHTIREALHGAPLDQVAAAIHRNTTYVSRKLSLLRFSAAVQAAIDGGDLEEATAIEIAKLRQEELREALAQRAIRDQLTRDQVRALMASRSQRRQAASSAARPLKRVLCPLPGGATIAVTCPDGLAELTTEEVVFALEYTLREARKALRRDVSAGELPAYFRQARPPADTGSAEVPIASAASQTG